LESPTPGVGAAEIFEGVLAITCWWLGIRLAYGFGLRDPTPPVTLPSNPDELATLNTELQENSCKYRK
jgi:hypothetical protein